MSESLQLAFRKLGAARTCGAVLGEGAALVVVERVEDASARRASVLGEIVGYGTAFAPPEGEGALVHPSSEALARAIDGALVDAGASAREVDLLVSGVSGLPAFDEAELAASSKVLGNDVGVIAPKRAVGETLGAGGAMGILAALAAFRHGRAPHRVRGTVRTPPRTVVVTSMGYYGNASALVLRAPAPRS
jgi:3-oxoacyl-(acyl-carrier-protein) synthase